MLMKSFLMIMISTRLRDKERYIFGCQLNSFYLTFVYVVDDYDN